MITKKDVAKVAGLAKLHLDEAELDKYTHDLGQILTLMDKLDELDLKDIEATSHAVEVTNVFREDEAKVSQAKEKVLRDAPQSKGTLFEVPKII